MSIENYLAKEGDVILVRATVKYDQEDCDSSISIKIGSRGYSGVLCGPEDIETFVHSYFAEGDQVTIIVPEGYEETGTVIATHKDLAWVETRKSMVSTNLANLKHLPDPST